MAHLSASAVLASLLLHVALLSTADAQSPVVRVCIPYDKTADYITQCQNFFNSTVPGFTYTCLTGPSASNCAQKIRDGTADITMLGGSGLYTAGTAPYNLDVVMSENYGDNEGDSYLAVAVVRKSFCDANPGITLQTLRGKKSCHTGYRKTSGWILPVGYLVNNNVMPVVDASGTVANDAETVASFFSTTCAPGTAGGGPGAGSTKYDGLCTGCPGDCGGSQATEPYYDYDGALRCMMEGADVAFTKHTTPLTYAADVATNLTWIPSLTKAEMRLVCPGTGGCKTVDQYESCNLGRAAPHAVMARQNWKSSSVGQSWVNAVQAVLANPTQKANFLSTGTELGGQGSFFLSEGTADLDILPASTTFLSYFGSSNADSYNIVTSMAVSPARWCTVSAADQAFCTRAVALMNGQSLGFTFSCVQRESDDACMAAIANKEADLRTYDGADIFHAERDYNLSILAGQLEGLSTPLEYYSVAVVNKDFCNEGTTLASLRGKRAAGSGFRRSAGWGMPIGLLASSGVMPIVKKQADISDDAESAAAFFSKMCFARAIDNAPKQSADEKGQKWEPMCTACNGDCSTDKTKEPYYDYEGAFRAVLEGAADVAFTKHNIAIDYSRLGARNQSWSTKESSEFRLLCAGGGCAGVNQFETCNLARVPAHGVLTNPDFAAANGDKMRAAITALSANAAFRSLVFNTTANPTNSVFSNSAFGVVGVTESTAAFLGTSLPSFRAMSDLTEGRAVETPNYNSGSGGGNGVDLTKGGLAGVIVGMLIAGVLLGMLGTWLAMRRRQSSWDKYAADGPALANPKMELSSKLAPNTYPQQV